MVVRRIIRDLRANSCIWIDDPYASCSALTRLHRESSAAPVRTCIAASIRDLGSHTRVRIYDFDSASYIKGEVRRELSKAFRGTGHQRRYEQQRDDTDHGRYLAPGG